MPPQKLYLSGEERGKAKVVQSRRDFHLPRITWRIPELRPSRGAWSRCSNCAPFHACHRFCPLLPRATWTSLPHSENKETTPCRLGSVLRRSVEALAIAHTPMAPASYRGRTHAVCSARCHRALQRDCAPPHPAFPPWYAASLRA